MLMAPSPPVGTETKSSRLEKIHDLIADLQTVSLEQYLRAARPDNIQVDHLPEKFGELEINDSCNIDCVMCKTSLAKRKKGLMDLGLFEHSVKTLREAGYTQHNLHTIGDPLANKRLAEYLEILRRHGCNVRDLSTNGLMMERHLDTLFEYRDVIDQVRISIDAASAGVYEKIRAGGKWDVLHRALAAFSERNAGAENPFFTSVANVICKTNFHEIAYIPEVFSYFAPPDRINFGFMNSLSPSNDFFESDNYLAGGEAPRRPCGFLWNWVYLLKDGSLTTCCRDYHGELIFGNIKTDNLADAYNSDFIQGLRRAHLDNDEAALPELCRTCFIVDPRLSNLMTLIIQHGYHDASITPDRVQQTINKIGPLLKAGEYPAVLSVVTEV